MRNYLNIGGGDTLIVEGTLTLNGGLLKTGTVEARGNVTVGSLYDGDVADASMSFTGTADQNITISGTPYTAGGTITVNKPSGSVTTFGQFRTRGPFELRSGTFTLGGDALFDGGNINLESGTFNAPSGTMTVAGPWGRTNTLFHPKRGHIQPQQRDRRLYRVQHRISM